MRRSRTSESFFLMRALSLLRRGKKVGAVYLLVMIAAALFLNLREGGENGGSNSAVVEGTVERVADGDTLTVQGPGGAQNKIRLYGIDAPEMSQPYGKASREWLVSRVMGQPVRVKKVNVDQYGRIVGRVYVQDRDVNLEAIEEGMAWYYEQYAPRENEFARAEKTARRSKAGLWRQNSPEPPWKYRREHRNNR